MANARPRPARTRRVCRSRRTAPRSSRRRSISAPGTGCTAGGTSRSARQRLRASPGPARGGRGRRDLPLADPGRRAGHDLRRRPADARLRVCRRRRPRVRRRGRRRRRRLQRRHRRGDVRRRPLGGLQSCNRQVGRGRPRRAASRRRYSGAVSTRTARRRRSTGVRRCRSRRGCGRRGSGSGRNDAPAGERVRVVDHPIRLDRVELAVRPWRTATVLIGVVAAVELVLLIVIGGALLAKPATNAHRAAPKAKAAAVVPTPAKAAPTRAAKSSRPSCPGERCVWSSSTGTAARAPPQRLHPASRGGLPHRGGRERAASRLPTVGCHVRARVRGRRATPRT